MAGALYDKEKAPHGRWATFVWIGSGLFLFLSDGGLRSLFTLKALVFFIAGMFAAAVVLGGFAYLLQRIFARGLMLIVSRPSPKVAALVRVVGLVLFVVDTVVTFLAARWIYYNAMWS